MRLANYQSRRVPRTNVSPVCKYMRQYVAIRCEMDATDRRGVLRKGWLMPAKSESRITFNGGVSKLEIRVQFLSTSRFSYRITDTEVCTGVAFRWTIRVRTNFTVAHRDKCWAEGWAKFWCCKGGQGDAGELLFKGKRVDMGGEFLLLRSG